MKKFKKCTICKKDFKQFQSTQKVCSPTCAITYANEKNVKEFNKETKRLKKKLKTRSDWLREAQREFNRFIRLRDYYEPCISCGTTNPLIQYAAGHYFTVGAHPELRFNENNVHKQCNKKCNMMLSGNIAAYRVNLKTKIGEKALDDLEGWHELNRYTLEFIKELKDRYRVRSNELQREIDNG